MSAWLAYTLMGAFALFGYVYGKGVGYRSGRRAGFRDGTKHGKFWATWRRE